MFIKSSLYLFSVGSYAVMFVCYDVASQKVLLTL